MKYAQICVRLLAVLLCLTLALIAPARGETQVIRVGYYENEVFQEGARDGAVKQGYAYEYYRKLSEYTGWKYAYIYDNFSDLYRMLLDGEIDMLAGLAMTEDRIGKIGYPRAPMGHETYSLVKHNTDDAITADPATFEGLRIGVLDSAVVDVLDRYLAEQNVNAQVMPYPDYTTLFDAFDRHNVDLLAAESDGVYGRDHAEVLLAFGASDYYLCVDVNRPDLLATLNRAQSQLAAEEPNYVNSLGLKYYPVTLSSRTFSAMEKTWLAEHDALRVGYFEDYLPYSGTDKNGNVTGLLRDLLPAMLDSLGVNKLKVSYKGYANYADMVADMGRGNIDLAFPVGGGLYYAEENGMYQTNPVVSSSTEVVYTGTYSALERPKIAVNTRNRMQYYYIKSNFPNAEILYYNTIEACLDAVRRGEANYTTLNGLRAGDILKNRRFRGLSLYPLPRSDDRCFGVAAGNEGLLKLINRGINVVGTEYAQKQAYKYTDSLFSYNVLDALWDHMVLLGSAMLALAALAIFLLTRDARRNRARVREKEEAQRALEEKNHELELSRAELQETDEIVADAGFGIWHILLEDGHPPRMRANAKMMELLGEEGRMPTEEALYEAWHSRIIPADLTMVENNVSEMLHGRLAETTYRWNHPRRGLIYVRSGGVMKASAGARRLLRGYHSDVTDIVNEEMARKEALSNALRAAERANQAKTEFLSNMSHDIRTPMNAIVGFSALAMSQLDHPEQVRDCLEKISVSSKHLLLLINDVLDMSRIESGQLTLEMSVVHLPDLIRELRTISVIHDDVASKQQELSIDIVDVHHEDIVTDQLRLNQVLLNLLSNAIKFTPAGGAISFRVIEMPCARDGWVSFEFRVKDNGVGMSEAFQSTLFDAFAREQNAAISNVQGTGLGLAITKHIVDMMGGTIAVHSEVGKGSEFVVNIPFQISETTARRDTLPEARGVRALVLDEDDGTCLSLCAMLKELGMRPEWADSGAEAVSRTVEARALGDPFRVCLLDLTTPDMNGIEVARRIRDCAEGDAPILILTAADFADIEAEARAAGVTVFCAKPVFISELAEALKEPLRARAGASNSPMFAGKRLLLAEDYEMNQLIAAAILEQEGFEVDVVIDGAEAVARVENSPAGTYDAILMDVRMPHMDGYEATRRIRALTDPEKASIPIIAVTANTFEEDRSLAFEAGMNGHLAKPYDIHIMLETLANVLK